MLEMYVLFFPHCFFKVECVFHVDSASPFGDRWLLYWTAQVERLFVSFTLEGSSRVMRIFCCLCLPSVACDCNPYGTVKQQSSCNPVTGQCECLPHVTGRDCGACDPGFYNLQSGQGCER